jgi:hypothetical protein
MMGIKEMHSGSYVSLIRYVFRVALGFVWGMRCDVM